ncbi:MAG: hypothetical protein ACXWCM_08525 [Acidimicrobiales bacterium]
MPEPVLPNQMETEGGSFHHYRLTLEAVKSMSDDELRQLAAQAGVDGAQTMTRDHLIAKIVDEPGANEL